jgi:hypothetical protein
MCGYGSAPYPATPRRLCRISIKILYGIIPEVPIYLIHIKTYLLKSLSNFKDYMLLSIHLGIDRIELKTLTPSIVFSRTSICNNNWCDVLSKLNRNSSSLHS